MKLQDGKGIYMQSLLWLSLATFALCLLAGEPPLAGASPKEDKIAEAWKQVERGHPRWIRDLKELAGIPAPTSPWKGAEEPRVEWIVQAFKRLGYDPDADENGNILVRRPGAGKGPILLICAHSDTVFASDKYPIVIREEGDRLIAPGIGDDASGVISMLALLEALDQAGIRTRGDLIFLSEMGEERYDPLGMEKVLEGLPKKPDMIIAIDRTLGEIMYGVSGGYLAQVNFTAPGTHPLTCSGVPPVPLAMAKAIQMVYGIKRPLLGPPPPPDIEATPHFLLNINAVEASTPTITGGAMITRASFHLAVNESIQAQEVLEWVKGRVHEMVSSSVREVNAAFPDPKKVGFEIQDRIIPSVQLPGMRDHKLVKSFERAYQALEIQPRPTPNGTTSANAGIQVGIPGIGIGPCVRMDNHSLYEWMEPKTMIPGVKAMVLALDELVGFE